MSREYTIATGGDQNELSAFVNGYIAAGYEPIGGVAVGVVNLNGKPVSLFFQAMLGPDPDVMKAREQALVEAGLK